MFLRLTLFSLLVAAQCLLISAENVITCDGNVQRLFCVADGTVINVQNSLYARTNASFCDTSVPSGKIHTDCYKTLNSQVSERCNGQKECEFTADFFRKDLCTATDNYNYINTNYTCISGQNKVICEGTVNTIDCGSNTISIISAMYGRTNPSICINEQDSSSTQNNQCFFNALDSVAKLCNNKMSCSLRASSTDFTDLCSGTKKYLSVSYKCIRTNRIIEVCEGSTANLTCGNLTIHVTSANFGRTDSTVCIDNRPICQITTANCYKTDSLLRVVNSCEGRSHCSVPVTTEFFEGDPCYGTYKYLQINYSCK